MWASLYINILLVIFASGPASVGAATATYNRDLQFSGTGCNPASVSLESFTNAALSAGTKDSVCTQNQFGVYGNTTINVPLSVVTLPSIIHDGVSITRYSANECRDNFILQRSTYKKQHVFITNANTYKVYCISSSSVQLESTKTSQGTPSDTYTMVYPIGVCTGRTYVVANCTIVDVVTTNGNSTSAPGRSSKIASPSVILYIMLLLLVWLNLF